MSTYNEVLQNVDWFNNFDLDESDIEELGDVLDSADLRGVDLNLSMNSNQSHQESHELLDFDNENQILEFDSSDDEPLASITSVYSTKRLKTDERSSVWTVEDAFQFDQMARPRIDKFEAAFELINKKTVLQRFFDYFPMKFLDEMAQKTSQKAVFSGYDFCVNGPLLLRFLAVSLRMNIYRLPSIRHYFMNEIGDISAKKFLDTLTFFRIRANLKCVWDPDIDQETRKQDPLWKIRPLLDSMRSAMMHLPRNPENLCIDEQIIPFTGGMPNKVIKTQPHPVGLKLYCLAEPSGTILNFIPYCGKQTFGEEMSPKPQGEAAVLTLCENVPEGCTIYLDRFFTSFGVLKALTDQKLKMTGTIMRNRLPVNLKEKVLSESVDRGSWRLLTNRDKTCALTCWKVSRVVLVLSSCST